MSSRSLLLALDLPARQAVAGGVVVTYETGPFPPGSATVTHMERMGHGSS